MKINENFIFEIVSRGIYIKEGEVLVVNKIGEDHYFLPGGRVELDEKVEDSLIREIKEELNTDCEIKNYAGCIEDSYSRKEKKWYQLGHFFIVDIKDLNPNDKPISNEKELKFHWHEIKELDNLNLMPHPIVKVLKNINSGRKFDGFWKSTI